MSESKSTDKTMENKVNENHLLIVVEDEENPNTVINIQLKSKTEPIVEAYIVVDEQYRHVPLENHSQHYEYLCKVYECKACCNVFECREHFDNHECEEIPDENKIKCLYCSTLFNSEDKEITALHMAMHMMDTNVIFRCNHCDFMNFSTRALCQKHIDESHTVPKKEEKTEDLENEVPKKTTRKVGRPRKRAKRSVKKKKAISPKKVLTSTPEKPASEKRLASSPKTGCNLRKKSLSFHWFDEQQKGDNKKAESCAKTAKRTRRATS